jgi:hypothetical protein
MKYLLTFLLLLISSSALADTHREVLYFSNPSCIYCPPVHDMLLEPKLAGWIKTYGQNWSIDTSKHRDITNALKITRVPQVLIVEVETSEEVDYGRAKILFRWQNNGRAKLLQALYEFSPRRAEAQR